MRVAIADDGGLFRTSLALLLRANDIEVTAEAGSGEELLTRLRHDVPDVVILDVRMPPGFTDEGIRTAVTLRQKYPDLGILVLSQYAEATLAAELLDTLDRGVGYLLKDSVNDVTALIGWLRQVIDGGSVVDPVVVAPLVRSRRRRSGLDDMTPRELDVLRLMAEGRSNLGIAKELRLAPKTVENHVTDIFTKLRLDNREKTENARVRAVLAFLSGTAHT
jgi:DNA-binding NarL/FixJ family response regulator